MNQNQRNQQFLLLATLPLLVAPWLNPFTSGPNASVLPFLFTWACTSVVLLWWAALAQTLRQRVQTMALAWLAAASINAVLGLLQYFDVSESWRPWVNQPGMGQAFGNLRQRNQFASLCTMGLAALGWWWVSQSATVAQRNLPKRLAAGALTIVLVAAVAASGSRTGALQLLILSALGLCWSLNAAGASARIASSTGTSSSSMGMRRAFFDLMPFVTSGARHRSTLLWKWTMRCARSTSGQMSGTSSPARE